MPSFSRQDFSDAVKRVLAQRSATRCSNPDCGASTSGPQLDASKALNIGVAAHITAASPGGPRYDDDLSDDERASVENGIWLCQNCAKLVDNDVPAYPVAKLRDWKERAESVALTRIGKSIGDASPSVVQDKWVNYQYPERLGISERLRSAGFKLVWASAHEESGRVDLDGWEHVIVDDNGTPVRLKIRDTEQIGGYLVLLMRRSDAA